jgi:DNA (cytosine-5)-methyltransferase 1
MANAHLYKQAGNSVSVPIIEAIAKNIMKALKK